MATIDRDNWIHKAGSLGLDLRTARMLVTEAARAHTNAERLCSDPTYNQGLHDTRTDAARRRIVALLAGGPLAGIDFELGGDPRGYCLKLHLPDGSFNSWGGAEAGWGVFDGK